MVRKIENQNPSKEEIEENTRSRSATLFSFIKAVQKEN